jgi:D-proline reductase (dithiol) PrdB
VGLVARHLEANGIPTLILGSARDVVELCGVPRFLFSDFPLGNPCGRPYDEAMQRAIVGMGLDLLESAVAPRITQQAPFVWSEDESWKDAYARVDPEDAERIRRAGDARRARQTHAKR